MRPLDGERIVLTGAAGGIGSLVAARLREAGAHVIGIDRVAGTQADEMLIGDLSNMAGLAELGEQLAGHRMAMDAPEHVADRIVSTMIQRRHNVIIGFPESLFVHVNALMPGLVDRALAGNDRKAAALFA